MALSFTVVIEGQDEAVAAFSSLDDALLYARQLAVLREAHTEVYRPRKGEIFAQFRATGEPTPEFGYLARQMPPL